MLYLRKLIKFKHISTKYIRPFSSNFYNGLSGSDIITQVLGKQKVKTVFGHPGGAILPTYDKINKTTDFRFVFTIHEQNATHMAEGHAKAMRINGLSKPGVAVVTSGPGATNTVTGLQDALMDHIPIVVIAGQVSSSVLNTRAFQEADMINITKACTKWNYQVKNVNDLPFILNKAFDVSISGCPGPVFIDVPKDVQNNIYDSTTKLNNTDIIKDFLKIDGSSKIDDSSKIEDNNMQKAIDLINSSKRPIFYLGQGVAISGNGCNSKILQLMNNALIPATTTIHALGCIPSKHPFNLGMLGMHGTCTANYSIQDADLIIGVGGRFDDRVIGTPSTFGNGAKIIHIDVNPNNVGLTIKPDIVLIGDANEILSKLLGKIHMKKLIDPYILNKRDDWLFKIENLIKKFPMKYPKDKLCQQLVISKVSERTNGNAIVSTGVGQHQMWTAQHYKWNYPNQLISSGGLGTMGFGVPSSIGAKLACPDKTVICFDGDGSFNMTGIELFTAVKEKIGVKIVLLNNNSLGMVRQWQDAYYGGNHSCSETINPDYVKFAESLGCSSSRCKKISDLDKHIDLLLQDDNKPYLLIVDVEEMDVYPMVGPGKALDEVIYE
jgi:acetolactate synthase I/II/III large subunit